MGGRGGRDVGQNIEYQIPGNQTPQIFKPSNLSNKSMLDTLVHASTSATAKRSQTPHNESFELNS